MKTYDNLAVGRPEVLLPKKGIDLKKWAVIACDQYTSEPEYWKKVQEFVGDEPSTLNLIYPEVYLAEADPGARIARIREQMKLYLDRRIFEEFEGFIYVERRTGTGIRKGLLVCLDLESYDYRKSAKSLTRATEGTILAADPAPGPDPGGGAARTPAYHGAHRRPAECGAGAGRAQKAQPPEALRLRPDAELGTSGGLRSR